MKSKLYLISSGYGQKGHSYEYIDRFSDYLSTNYDIRIPVHQNCTEYIGEKYVKVDVDYKDLDENNFLKFGRVSRFMRGSSKLMHYIYFYYRFLKHIKFLKEDIVFIMDYEYYSVLFLVVYLRLRKIPFLFWIHSASNTGSLIYFLYKTSALHLIKLLLGDNKVVTNGTYIKEILVDKFGFNSQQIDIIQYVSESTINLKPMTKNFARVSLGLPEYETIFLFFGMLRKDKQIELMIHAISQAENSPFIIIAGSESGITRRDIESWLKVYDVHKYKLFIKYLSEKEIHLLYSASDALIMTYGENSVSQSGPLAFARNYSLPVISTNVGEIGRYITDEGVGIVSNEITASSVGEAIDRFFDLYNKGKLVDMESNIESARKKYSWKQASIKYLDIINNMINKEEGAL